ncbi:hypothetical protein ZIOFF_030442 [Zingiber officinale]|uniref:Uncharacterized protein n=1 Tax=Zingiber officinale TaxID=94328 RepID=A0A8J5GPG2_ZINOF|nr:hypothetical protein ZIOFF_030442 [Zingiber officinale]
MSLAHPAWIASILLLLLLLHSLGYICMVSKLFARVICAALTCVFASGCIKFVAVGVVGSLVGAITGALIGLATESGLLRGSGIGAITGTVFSIEVVESSHNLWNSRDCGSWSLLHLMNALSLPFMETLDLYETDGNTKGMPMDEVEKLPKSQVTARGSLDESGERIRSASGRNGEEITYLQRILTRESLTLRLGLVADSTKGKALGVAGGNAVCFTAERIVRLLHDPLYDADDRTLLVVTDDGGY